MPKTPTLPGSRFSPSWAGLTFWLGCVTTPPATRSARWSALRQAQSTATDSWSKVAPQYFNHELVGLLACIVGLQVRVTPQHGLQLVAQYHRCGREILCV